MFYSINLIAGTGGGGSGSGDVIKSGTLTTDEIIIGGGTNIVKASGTKLSELAKSDLDGYLNGMSIERQSLSLVVSGTSVYLDIEAIDGGDINYWISGTKHTLDCTAGSGAGGTARIEINQGTAIQPVASLVYVTYDEQSSALKLFTTPLEQTPDADFAPVAIITIQDYTNVTANSALVLQRTTEAITHNGKGAISWEREKLRGLGAQYWSGIDQSLDITTNPAAEDDIDFSVSSGTVFQLHRQHLTAASVSTDGIQVANASGAGTLTNFEKLTNLNSIHEIADGTALIDGDSINVVIWASVNYGGMNKLFFNLPTGKYSNDSEAILDSNKTAVTTVPAEFRTTAYLIGKLVLKYTTADSGTWTNLLTESISTWRSASKTFATPNYPSNYDNNAAQYLDTIVESGAEAIRIIFDDFNTEANFDYIRLRNAAETNIFSYDGNLGAFTSAGVIGDTVKIWFSSDGSVTRQGVQSLGYEYLTTSSVGHQIIDLRGIPLGFNLGASGGIASVSHNSTAGLNTGDYIHLTAAEYAALGTELVESQAATTATETLDLSTNKILILTLTASITTLTLTAPAGGKGSKCMVKVIQGGSGSYTIDWSDESVEGSGGAFDPTLTTAIGGADWILLVFDGTEWNGFDSLNFSSV